MINLITLVLFFIFALVFLATATVTLLGLCKLIYIKEEFLKKLFASVILEVAAAMVALFSIIFLTPEDYEIKWIDADVKLVTASGAEIQKLEDKASITLEFAPPIAPNTGNGKFLFRILFDKKNDRILYPTLKATAPGYLPVNINLDPDKQEDNEKNDIKMTVSLNNEIILENIKLVKENELYDHKGDGTAELVGDGG